MPWTVNDVDKHKKGLTTAQKKQWVATANSVLKKCQDEGGSGCEAKAIRIANSKFSFDGVCDSFSEQGVQPVVFPVGALRFEEEGALAKVFAKEDTDGEEDRMELVGYSGGIIKGHWYWGDLAFDLEGMKFNRKTYPVLEAHDTGRKIAFTGKPVIEDYKLKLDPDKTKFVDTEPSLEFRKLSKQGFPYQSSIYALPTKIQRLSEEEEADVNGYKMKGPGTIWRECEFKEVSICVFGYDSNTSSKAFSNEEDQEEQANVEITGITVQEHETEKGETKTMTFEELKEKHPELVAEIEKAAEAKFAKEKEQLATQFSTEMSGVREEVATLRTQNLDLQKKDEIRTQAEQFAKAQGVWDVELASSSIPENLRDKVRSYVDHTKFMKDGLLDKVAFTEAVKAEITDWETKFSAAVEARSGVSGIGTVGRSVSGQAGGSTEEFSDDDQKWLDGMNKFVS